MRRASGLWALALTVAVLWPAHVLAPLGGIPLNTAPKAALLGVLLPALWWMNPGFLRRWPARVIIVALLVVKAATALALPQEGLCARFSTAPFSGTVHTIAVDEPRGMLRSWDVRSDWTSNAPRCTAIFDRAYRSQDEFPAWFFNLLNAVRPNPNDLQLDVDGYVTVDRPGTLRLETGEDMDVAGDIDARVSATNGSPIEVALTPGSHAIHLRIASHGDRWRFVALWNGSDAWTSTRLTAMPPARLDGWLSGPARVVIAGLVWLLLVAWAASCAVQLGLSTRALAWSAVASFLLIVIARWGRFDRFATVLLAGAIFVPASAHQRNVRAAFALIGIPWLAWTVARSWALIGRFTQYSLGDDWHFYQVAAYRIFLNGYWFEGGSRIFYVQPFYRWMAGALHLLFGDSSVGELYWDSACLLASSLLCFSIVKRVGGFTWGVAAAVATLVTFTLSPIWYLIGRGLTEISGLGWMTLASVFLLRARHGRGPAQSAAALGAGICAVLMFYTRLNHLLMTGFLLAWLLPLRTPSRFVDLWRALRHVHRKPVAIYVATVAAGVALFAFRTWWYTGHFSVIYGTSFAAQQSGLRPWTLGSRAVWAGIGESLAAQLTMHEPPAIDPRASLVVGGAILSLLAVLQVPQVSRLPAPLAIVTIGTMAGSLFAYTHEYPGRMAVHIVPFAVAVTACAVARMKKKSEVRSQNSLLPLACNATPYDSNQQ